MVNSTRLTICALAAALPMFMTDPVLASERPGGPPSNDLCGDVTAEALAIGTPLTFTGTTAGATATGDAEPGTTLDVPGFTNVWHAFTIDACANVTLEYCGTAPFWPNVWHLLVTTCPATNDVINATSFNSEDCGDDNQTIFFAGLPAGTYYVPVLNDGFTSIGAYTITATASDCGTGVPENDLCSGVDADVLTIGTPLVYHGTTLNATLAGDAEPGTTIDQVGLPSVWHSFTLDDCANVTIDYCSTAPTWPNVWHLLATTCPATNDLINSTSFNTDDCGDGNQTVFFAALPAGTYYVPVLNDGFNSVGPYTLTITASDCGTGVPENDLCSNVTPDALEIGTPLVYNGTTLNATAAGDAEPGSIMDQVGLPSVWHAITLADCANVTIAYCGTTPSWPNVWHLLATTCPANDILINATSFNSDDCGDGNQTVFFAALAAGTYYIPVLNDGFNSIGPYTLTVTATECGTGVPSNDVCGDVSSSPLAMGSSLTFNGDNTNATAAGDAEPGSVMDIGLGNVWHVFTIAECADVTVNLCGTDPAFANVWNLMATTCPANDALVFTTTNNDTDCGDGNRTGFYDDLPAGTYYVPVLNDPFSQSVGPYTLTITAIQCDSALCDGGLVSGNGETELLVCLNGEADLVTFSANSNSVESYSYILTDGNDLIITELLGNDIDANTLALGTYRVYGASYNGALTDVTGGAPIGDVSADGSCFDLSSNYVTIGVEICQGVVENTNTAWSVFPNPTDGEISLLYNGPSMNATVQLFDPLGRVVRSMPLTLNSGRNIPFAHSGELSPGAYMLRIATATNTMERTVIVR